MTVDSRISDDVFRFLHDHTDDMVAFVEMLVRAESPSLEPERQQAVLALIADRLGKAGYTTTHVNGDTSGGLLFSVPGDRQRGAPYQLAVGHADTVWPVGTIDKMPITTGDGRMTGPGIYDMKSGIAILVYALIAIRELHSGPLVTPVVLITTDEEIGSHDSRRWIKRLARRAERAFVLEPALGSAGQLKTTRKGTGRYTLFVEGKAAHSGLEPEKGASAILELSHAIQSLFALNDHARGTTVNVGTIDGGIRTNVIAPAARADVEVRVARREDAERVDAAIRTLRPTVPGVKLHVEGGPSRPPLEPTPRNRALWQTARALGMRLGLSLEEGMAGGASDGNFTSQFTATLDGLGAVGGGAHARHEFILVDSLPERAALLAMLMLSPPAQTDEQAAG